MATEKEFEFVGSVISGKVNVLVAEEVFFYLGKFLLRHIDLLENEGYLFGDEGEVLVVGVKIFWGRIEGVEGEEVGGDDGEDHENVNCGGRQGCSSESGSSIAYFQRHGTHLLAWFHNRNWRVKKNTTFICVREEHDTEWNIVCVCEKETEKVGCGCGVLLVILHVSSFACCHAQKIALSLMN